MENPEHINPTNYVHFNFRNNVRWIYKDNLYIFPYLYNLVGMGSLQFTEPEKDNKGNIMVDESYQKLEKLLEYHVLWQLDPNMYNVSVDSNIKHLELLNLVEVACRMGMNIEFINVLKNICKQKLFKCYYCNNIYIMGSKESKIRCYYHKQGCNCKSRSLTSRTDGCITLPFHTQEPIEIADPPKK